MNNLIKTALFTLFTIQCAYAGSSVESTERQRSETDLQVSAQEYYADYQRNKVSADQKYRNKRLMVTGTVWAFSKERMTLSIVGTNTNNGSNAIRAYLDISKYQALIASSLVKGDVVQLICTGGSIFTNKLTLDDCRIDGVLQSQHHTLTGKTLPLDKSQLTKSNNPYSKQFLNCRAEKTNIEKVICGDKELSKKSQELSELLFKTYQYTSADQQIYLKVGQDEWLKERNKCKNKACLIASYSTRINQLDRASAINKQ